jgi:hypothetical protein
MGRGSRVRTALCFAVLLVLLAGCAQTPQAVLQVPPGGSYTFGPRLMLNGNTLQYGWAGGTVAVCAAEELTMRIEVSGWSEVGLWLTFDGASQGANNWWTTSSFVTTPVGPGCGTLSVQPYTTHFDMPSSLTVTVTRA